MISLDSHSSRETAYSASATQQGVQRRCGAGEAGHLSDVTLVTEAAYLQDGHDSESELEGKKKRLIEFPVYDHARYPALLLLLLHCCMEAAEDEAKNPVRLSCTSLPRILAGSIPNFLCQESNGTD